MQEFTQARTASTPDQIWLLEHQAVYTYGAHTKPKMPDNCAIPVEASDRGGNITFHGPGQLIIYPLIDTRRLSYSVHGLVTRLEQLATDLLADFDLEAYTNSERRGVYLDTGKVASIGLRFKKYCSYHGMAINVNMDLAPFLAINPCGYQQAVTSIADNCQQTINMATVTARLLRLIPKHLLVNIEAQND